MNIYKLSEHLIISQIVAHLLNYHQDFIAISFSNSFVG
jgi:hypothetical protein